VMWNFLQYNLVTRTRKSKQS